MYDMVIPTAGGWWAFRYLFTCTKRHRILPCVTPRPNNASFEGEPLYRCTAIPTCIHNLILWRAVRGLGWTYFWCLTASSRGDVPVLHRVLATFFHCPGLVDPQNKPPSPVALIDRGNCIQHNNFVWCTLVPGTWYARRTTFCYWSA